MPETWLNGRYAHTGRLETLVGRPCAEISAVRSTANAMRGRRAGCGAGGPGGGSAKAREGIEPAAGHGFYDDSTAGHRPGAEPNPARWTRVGYGGGCGGLLVRCQRRRPGTRAINSKC